VANRLLGVTSPSLHDAHDLGNQSKESKGKNPVLALFCSSFQRDLLLNKELASEFTRLALRCITREYPNQPGHVINDSSEIRSPRSLHPAFYGCFDWHSSVHSHWMLVRLLRLFPELPEAPAIRAALNENLTATNLLAEAAYFRQPNRQSFERTYGWAWLLKLAEELHDLQDAGFAAWSRNLQPLVEVIVARYQNYLPKLTYPIRIGTHTNTAFGLAFALEYARACNHRELEKLIVERACAYYAGDANYPAEWELGGNDFLSPSLTEADLMCRIMEPAEFKSWFDRFLPEIAHGKPEVLLHPAEITDRSDPMLVHLDGLHLSRAWCMRRIASVLPQQDPARGVLIESADRHTKEGLTHISSGNYAGEHWLASFAVYLLST